MTDPELTRLALAVLIQAPFAFRLGFVVRDGRQWLFGSLFLAVGSAVAALAAGLSESLLVGAGAALAAVFVLAHARFTGAHRAPSAAVPQQGPTPPAATQSGAMPPLAAPPGGTSPPAAAADAEPHVSPLLSGMAFLADLLTVADRIGELRHRRRLRKLQRRQAAGQGREPPVRSLRVRAKR